MRSLSALRHFYGPLKLSRKHDRHGMRYLGLPRKNQPRMSDSIYASP